MSPELSITTAAGYGLAELATLFTRGFEDYVVPVQVTADALAARVRAESVDLAASYVVARAGEPVALALMARRGWTSRLAAMGVVRGARRTGAGWFAVGHLLDQARARGDRRVVLEVIETNAPAVRLYERAGFAATRRLVGFRAERVAPAEVALAPCDPAELGRQLARLGGADLPWQLAPATLSQVAPPALGFSLHDAAFALVTSVSDRSLGLGALLTLPPHRGRGLARQMLAGLASRYPGRAITVTSIVPEGLVDAFCTRVGLERAALTQLEMTRAP